MLGNCLRPLVIVLAISSGAPASDFTVGVSLLRQGSTFASVRALRRALASGDQAAHLPLAEAYFVLNQHRFFAEEIAQAKTANPSDPEPYYVNGRYLFQTAGNFDAASQEFDQALSRDSKHVKARCYLGIALQNMQRTEDAETHLLKAVDLLKNGNSSFYLPYQTLASLYLQQDRADDASTAIEHAVKIAPNIPLNQFLLGKAKWAQKKAPEAIAALNKAIALDEAFLEAHYLLARVLEAQGDTAGAQLRLAQFKNLREIYGVGRRP